MKKRFLNEVEQLKDRASKIMEDSRIERLRHKLTERAQEIKSAPESAHTDFYCVECKRDFGAIGWKQVRKPQGSVWFAFYEAHCPEGHKAIRYITDKIEDPYFTKSPFIRAQQDEFEDAQIPPWHPRFKVLYPLQYERLKQMEYDGALSRLEVKHE